MEKLSKIYVAGHTGLVGSAITRVLQKHGFKNLLLKTHKELDLTNQKETDEFFAKEKPQYIFVAAGLVGGINANIQSPLDFFSVNMAIAQNVILSAQKYNAKKLLYLGSACMYPKEAKQPMRETELLNGVPEITNEGYALAKICGSRMCSYMYKQYGIDFISAIPANTYGLGDCFDEEKSHVIPALLMKYYNAKKNNHPNVVLWGTGKALREFIYNEDIAEACIFLMNNYSGIEPINIGVNEEISIMNLSILIKDIVGYNGEIMCDTTKPDGMFRRMVDSTKINQLGWKPKTSLEKGLKMVYDEFIKIKK